MKIDSSKKKSECLSLSTISLMLFIGLILAPCVSAQENKKPNILFIASDDLNNDMNVFDDPY